MYRNRNSHILDYKYRICVLFVFFIDATVADHVIFHTQIHTKLELCSEGVIFVTVHWKHFIGQLPVLDCDGKYVVAVLPAGYYNA